MSQGSLQARRPTRVTRDYAPVTMRPAQALPLSSPAWHGAIGGLIENSEHGDLPARLVNALALLAPIEDAAVFVYPGRSRPMYLFDTFDSADAKKGVRNYVDNTYFVNPFYGACLNGLAEGVYRIRDLAPNIHLQSDCRKWYRICWRASEELGYVTESWPEGLQEVDICVRLDPETFVEFGVYRRLAAGGFSDDDIVRLQIALPVVGALLRRYWSVRHGGEARVRALDRRVVDAFANFGSSMLTDREREVVRMILRGHSSESIGCNLGISIGTVKTHRKNAYAKLDISSQSELMALFLESLE